MQNDIFRTCHSISKEVLLLVDQNKIGTFFLIESIGYVSLDYLNLFANAYVKVKMWCMSVVTTIVISLTYFNISPNI